LDDPPGPHISGKKAIVGHTPQANYEIRDLGHLAIIDTVCVDGGWLTALDVNTKQIWQTDNMGQRRQP
jgi:serine/threonine protein phosphatase 1